MSVSLTILQSQTQIKRMCLCAKSKPKPTEQQLQRPVISSRIPKSTVMFSADDYENKPFTDQSKFNVAKKAEIFVQDKIDRDSHYHEQATNSKQSKLLSPKQLLNYELDAEDGISKTCVINTFHYESVLNHCFVNPSQETMGVRVSRQRNTENYENVSPPSQYMARDSRKSQLRPQSKIY